MTPVAGAAAPATGATAARAGEAGQVVGQRIVPADYVAEHLALGYAFTGPAAQGATVDTSHSVVTPRTGPLRRQKSRTMVAVGVLCQRVDDGQVVMIPSATNGLDCPHRRLTAVSPWTS